MGKGRNQLYKILVSVAQFNGVRANQMLFQVCEDDERVEMDRIVSQAIDASIALTSTACVVTYKQRGACCGIETSCVLGLYKTGAISPLVIAPKNQHQS